MRKVKLPFSVCILVCIIFLVTESCVHQKKIVMAKNKTKDVSSSKGKYMISVPIVIKNFVKKNGEITKQTEIYIRRSIQDYYIKFCESNISREDLETKLATIAKEIKVVTLEVEFRDGHWDSCDGNLEQQSRMGAYVIIHRMVE
ncbi:hypothetical protein IMCC3317_47530 [Kordia antarctica]|uniref:Uncharacterized protein n=1 Tax=Kordia antarctica TaxID=1218801 RepID=A0A7L4ZRJ9_9FLAO|nr:hypothetical protein [Kordia antarctica]QHI39343.1 hypothetical protein IMCC3317_47530 [Kordia antarctica]